MRSDHADLPYWEAPPETQRSLHGPILIWFGGIVLPVLAAIYGVACIFAAQALIMTPDGFVVLHGGNATIVGIGSLAFAGVLHCTCFWDSIHGSTQTCARRKLLCLGILGVCAYALCLRLLTVPL